MVTEETALPTSMEVQFVLLPPSGDLVPRTLTTSVRIDDEYDFAYQPELWDAVNKAVDPYRLQSTSVALDEGIWARVIDLDENQAALRPEEYPANVVAWTMMTVLGHESRRWFGTIALVGSEDEVTGLTASLTPRQLELIQQAHIKALQPRR
ncbi:hypothetical protein SUDANB95_07900 (plasmid) [Actinosynnema sp. ALI-1.44]